MILEKFFSRLKRNSSSAVLKLTAALSLCSFAVLSFDAIVMKKIGAATDGNFMAIFYSATIATLGLGCVLFPVSKVFLRGGGGRASYHRAVTLTLVVYVCSVAALIFSSNLPLMAFSALAAILNLGYLLAWQFWSMSLFLNGANCSGRVIGAGILTATLALNYSNTIKSSMPLFLAMALSMAGSAAIVHRLWKSGSHLPPADAGYKPDAHQKGLLYIAAVALMTASFGISHGLFLKTYPAAQSNTMSFYYATHGAAALFFGVLRDLRQRVYKYLAPALIIIFALSPFLINYHPSGFAMFSFIGWAYAGLFCLTYLLPFIDAAPSTGFPELWAACGAITRYLVSGIIIIPTALLVEFISLGWLASINAAVAALLLKTLALAENGVREEGNAPANEASLDGSREDEETFQLSAESDAGFAGIAGFAGKYKLTLAESKALSRIIASEESLKVISAKENVSERTFQRYLSKVYEKTGTKTRAGLVAMYHREAWVRSSPKSSEL